jgi:hypothetical protein
MSSSTAACRLAGGGKNGNAQVGYLSIRNGKRFNTDVQLQGQEQLLETDRGLAAQDSAFRTLTPSDTQITINSTYHQSAWPARSRHA